jgi:hypothetical protein
MFRNCLLIAVLPLVCAGSLWSQTDSGSLTGRVVDPSGAAVPATRLKLKNLGTGTLREATTSDEGLYQFNLVAPGLYQVAAEAPGFRRFVDNGVRIQVAQATTLEVRLTVGEVADSVEVTGTASLLNTESVSQGTVITQEKIVSLPLNGRQFIDLALLVPGTNLGGRSVQQNNVRLNQTGGLSSSGGRTNNNLFLFDGAVNTDPDYNALSYVPIVDSLAEFQVQTSQYSAQYGRASGGQINVVSKSGSNAFHGTAWEFLRNRAMDARPFNSVTPKLPKNQRNQFGGTVGGPVWRDKLFFFAAFEALRLRQAGVGITTVLVPTALERSGDFSATNGQFFDPDTLAAGTRTAFPGNRIPATRLNPLTQAAIRAMPLPNIGTNQFVNGNAVLKQDSNNGSIRIDWAAGAKTSVFGRYSISDESSVIPDVVTSRERLGAVRPQNVALGVTRVISPAIVNEVRLGYNRLSFQDGLPEPNFDVAGVQQPVPRFRPSGYPVMGGAGAFTGTTGGGTVLTRNNTYQIYDNLSWVRGRMSLKFGGEVLRLNYVRSEAAAPLGDFQFLAGYTSRTAANDGTGNALATMILGLPNQGNRQVTPTRIDGVQHAASFYAQSDFRVRPNFTVNVGLRYEISPPVWDTRRQIASVDYRNVPWPTQIFQTGPLGTFKPTLFTCGLGPYPRGCAYTDKNNFSPRLGVVWNAAPKTVIRAGGGIFYALTDMNGFLQLARSLPTNIQQNLNAASSFVPSFRGFNIFGNSAEVGRGALTAAGLDLFQRTSYSAQTSFSVQRELMKDTIVEATYLMTLGIKLQQNVQPNNAQPGTAAVDPRRPYAGVTFHPSMVFPYYITPISDSVPVTQVNMYANSAQSNYHALLMRFERRFRSGFSLLSSYTYSKAITNAPQFRNAGGANGSENSPPQNSYNLAAERGIASFDVRQRWVNSLVWDLPFGPGRQMLQQGALAHVVGGWQLASIIQMQTGFPFTINLNGDTAGIGGGTGGILIRPNAVTGASVALPGNQRSTSRWFNTAAFTLPPAGTFGNLGRNTVAGPGLINFDAAISRTFTIGDRLRLQARGEFFNMLNHSNYRLVGRLINVADFGRVSSQFDPRQVQLGVKLLF